MLVVQKPVEVERGAFYRSIGKWQFVMLAPVLKEFGCRFVYGLHVV